MERRNEGTDGRRRFGAKFSMGMFAVSSVASLQRLARDLTSDSPIFETRVSV